jgi:hypothetical protein
MATDYKGSRDVQLTPGHNPNGLDMIHSPKAKNGGAAPRQIVDIKLFQRIPLISDDLRHGTSSIGKDMSLPFQESKNVPIGCRM